MPQFDYLQIDVFAARRGGGNPLGVVLDADDWSPAAMQAFARWTNLVETTFVSRPDSADADYRLRIFTPQREIPFAGHPSIGSAHALLASRPIDASRGQLIQQCGAGLLPLRIERGAAGQRLFVRSPAAREVGIDQSARAQALALLPDALRDPRRLACVHGGRRWWLAEFPDPASVRGWRPPHADIAALAQQTDTLGLCIFARETGAAPALVVRAFPAGVGISEDPASGAANGMIASWLSAREPEGAFRRGYSVSQGREIGHDAAIDIEIEPDGTIWVGGASNTIIHGRVDWEIA